MALSGNIGAYVNRPYNPNRGSAPLAPFTPFTPAPAWELARGTAATVSAPTPPIAVGLESPAYEAVLYGKEKPLYVGGSMLIGGRIIEGPFFGGAPGEPTVSAIYYFAENANPTGSHDITEFRLRGAVAAVDGSGYFTDPQFAGARVQYRTGTRTQMPFDVSIARDGANAIAYRQGIVVSLENMPLRAFNGIIPFLGVYVEDSSFGDPADPVSRKDLIEVLLRYARLSDSEFQVSVPGTWHFCIVPSKQSLLDFLQSLRRLCVHWSITYTDKMRIIDPTNFSIAVEATPNNAQNIIFTKTDPLIIPRRKNLSYIDIDRDNEPNIVSAQEDIYPAPSTSSVDEETIEIPVGMTASEATADVNVSLYEELAVRSQLGATLLGPVFGAEPGDAIRYTDSRVHTISYVGRINQTQHDLNKFTNDVNAGEVLNCGAGGGGGDNGGGGDDCTGSEIDTTVEFIDYEDDPSIVCINYPLLEEVTTNAIYIYNLVNMVYANFPILVTIEGGVDLELLPVCTSLDFTSLETCANVFIDTIGSTDILFPALTTLTGGDFTVDTFDGETIQAPLLTTIYDELRIDAGANLTSIDFSSLQTTGNDIEITDCPLLPTISFPAVTTIGGSIRILSNATITSASFPSLTSVASSINLEDNPVLTTIDLSALLSVGANSRFDGCALTQATVDALLVKLASLDGTGGTTSYDSLIVNLGGGTNAAPSAPGLAAKATLEGRSCVVTVN